MYYCSFYLSIRSEYFFYHCICILRRTHLLEALSQVTLVLRMAELQDVFPQQVLQDDTTEFIPSIQKLSSWIKCLVLKLKHGKRPCRRNAVVTDLFSSKLESKTDLRGLWCVHTGGKKKICQASARVSPFGFTCVTSTGRAGEDLFPWRYRQQQQTKWTYYLAYLPVSLPSCAQTYLVPSLVMCAFVCVGGGAL